MTPSTPAVNEAHALKCEMATEVLRLSGKLRLKVNGWSMLPTIRPGDELLIESSENRVIAKGDIVLCGRGRRIVIHRVVADAASPAGRILVTRGDAMPQADIPLSESEILGKVGMIVRNQKHIIPAKQAGIFQTAFAWLLRRSNVLFRVAARYCRFSETPLAHIP